MTENEAIKQLEFDQSMILFDPTTGEEITLEVLKAINKDNYLTYIADEVAIEALKEIQKYREIGTVEQVKNQKENLNVAYQIINDYEQYGTIEDFKMAQRYMRLVKSHGAIGQVINSCAEYEEIGTVEECRKAVEKQKTKKCAINSCPDHTHYKCPSCEKIHMTRYKHGCQMGRIPRYCEYCGQAIDENLEGMEDE